MLKSCTALILSALFHSTAHSEAIIIKLDSVCGSEAEAAALVKSHGETPVLRAISNRRVSDSKSVDVPTVLFINNKTQSYTLMENPAPDVYCIISVGESISIVGNPV